MSGTQNHRSFGSLTMYTMVEALVRERMHEQLADAHRARLVRTLSANQRWQRREARFRQAELRHRRQGQTLADTLAAKLSADVAPSRTSEYSWA